MQADIYNEDIISSLEDFGLSKYEARAYITMIGKGSMAASEIAYYSNLPRTKVYTTIKKLQKKRLCILTQQKPVVCNAVSPAEAFGEIISLHDRRLKNMRKIIEKLQKINDEYHRPKGSIEKRYYIFDANLTLEKLNNAIITSKVSIDAVVDSWGLHLLSQCRQSIIKSISNGVKIRLVIDLSCIGTESLTHIPDGVELRISDSLSDSIIVDSSTIIMIDSSNGKAVIFSSLEVFGTFQVRRFGDIWTQSMPFRYIAGIPPENAVKAVKLCRVIENGISGYMLEQAINSQSERDEDIMKKVEDSGLRISKMTVIEILSLIDYALRIGYDGGLKIDNHNNLIRIHSKIQNKSILPWAYLVYTYLKKSGNESKIMQSMRQGNFIESVHIKPSRPIH